MKNRINRNGWDGDPIIQWIKREMRMRNEMMMIPREKGAFTRYRQREKVVALRRKKENARLLKS